MKKGQRHDWGYKISNAMRGKKKTPEHIRKIAEALRTRKEKPCKECEKGFYPQTSIQKYCSIDCMRKGRAKQPSACKRCGNQFIPKGHAPTKFCSPTCYGAHMSENRMGKKNPAYRNGFATKRGLYTGKHLRACAKYRKDFMQRNERAFCEVCGCNETGILRFEVHHIYFASLYPKHPQLHNFRNLVHICIRCHNKFHSGDQYRWAFEKLESDRGLKELFAKT
jgi:hypothetical protein